MANNCRVLKSKSHRITQGCHSKHMAVDLVKYFSELDYITAHSDGVVVAYRNNYATTDKTGNSYGNYVKIKHDNNYYTLYAHLGYKTVTVKKGDKVKAGQVIGYMGNTGHSFGGHLHFEVYRGDKLINPTEYLTKDLPIEIKKEPNTLKYKIGDKVNINGVYASSESVNKLKPAVTKGTITKIIETARNPYLLENGNIGWVNDSCIVSKVDSKVYKTVTNCTYLNLRKTPKYDNNVYCSVQKGTKLEYLGLENGWAKVLFNDRTLYCGSKYLK